MTIRTSALVLLALPCLGLPTAANASPWTTSGPGQFVELIADGEDDPAAMRFHMADSGYSEQLWTLQTTADSTQSITVPFTFHGFFGWFLVDVTVESFIIDAGGDEQTQTIIDVGPGRDSIEPSGGFHYSGQAQFDLEAGDTYGFRFGGEHFDGTNVLAGYFTVQEDNGVNTDRQRIGFAASNSDSGPINPPGSDWWADDIDTCEGNDRFGDIDDDGICDGIDICVPGDNDLDDDSDGVPDDCDVCPDADDTIDTDDDDVPDDCDICPTGDDSVDSDNDSVPNDCDICPGSDDRLDDDSDDVPNDCDVCPGSDDRLDDDSDDVPNDCDMCPGSDDALDDDLDTVPNDCDVCADGDDALDADLDTVPDACDICADGDDALDADTDGVPDDCDICANGDDAIDADADGVPDACDDCPEDPEITTGDCSEPDTEADTEPDTEADTEPDTEADTEPDTEGDTEPDTEADTEFTQGGCDCSAGPAMGLNWLGLLPLGLLLLRRRRTV